MTESLKIYEVGPRDGLQNEAVAVSTEHKLALIDGLVSAGLRHIEVTSFVHPKAVPQMADADEVMQKTLAAHQEQGGRFIGLVFNQRGYERAVSSGARAISFGVSVSDTFSQQNTGMPAGQLMQTTRKLVEQAKQDGYEKEFAAANLQSKLAEAKKLELERNKTVIIDLIEKDIAGRFYFQNGKIQIGLRNDQEIKDAVDVLGDGKRYEKLLKK